MRARATSAGRPCAVVTALVLGLATSVAAQPAAAAVVPAPWIPALQSSAAQAPPPASATQAGAAAARIDLAEFVAGLERMRAGEEGELARLRVTADRCARLHGRPDVLEVVEFYAGLEPTARARGLELEQRFRTIYARLKAADTQRVSIEEWRAARPEILADLDDLLVETRNEPDFSVAARVLSLRALILRQRVVEDFEFDAPTKRKWIQDGVRDAEESITLFTRAGLMTPRLEPTFALAWFDWADGDWSAAHQDFSEVLVIARRVGRREYEERALNGLVRLAHDSGDMPEIARLLDEMACFQAPALAWGLAARHGAFLLALDEPERAAEFLARNKPASEKEAREWSVLMRSALARKGDVEGAAAHEKVLAARDELDFATRAALAEARLDRGRADLALALLGDEPWPVHVTSFLRAARERILGSALLALDRRRDAIAAYERAFAIGDSVEARMPASDVISVSSSVVGEVIGVETVARLARAWIEESDPLRAAVVIEDRQSRSIRSSLSRGAATMIDAEAVRAWAASYESGLLTWIIGSDTSVVVHVGRTGTARGAVLQLGARSLEAAVRRLREAAIANDAAAVAEFAAEIQDTLLPESIRAALNPARGRVLLCAHGPLERLPFDLLPIFQGDLVSLVLPGLVEASPGVGLTDLSKTAWTLLGDPIHVSGTVSLPGGRAELAEIAVLHPQATVKTRAVFDRAALNDALASGRALHIATHLRAGRSSVTSIDTRAANAGFELSNGERFGVDDILRVRPRLPLAVLSACDTGSGLFVDAQASHGVSKAFLESGTRNLLVTSWPVEDQAARRYATAFHRALSRGDSPSRAAASARDALRAEGAAIADWAAFRLVGRD
ncbi:MAG: CHAT domain-containing protein [Planctomycetes bacterium]|nr:CHAT domain-containing protein [Planctomycetota bacterium]